MLTLATADVDDSILMVCLSFASSNKRYYSPISRRSHACGPPVAGMAILVRKIRFSGRHFTDTIGLLVDF